MAARLLLLALCALSWQPVVGGPCESPYTACVGHLPLGIFISLLVSVCCLTSIIYSVLMTYLRLSKMTPEQRQAYEAEMRRSAYRRPFEDSFTQGWGPGGPTGYEGYGTMPEPVTPQPV
mmetsp:Transcript_18532/g.60369  ORF Transcript_18532/g.60369 Transcript_18532/m.60369 type:complete len:119 (+) Transcript_18532:551-907(+)